jgi:hypothetical protein
LNASSERFHFAHALKVASAASSCSPFLFISFRFEEGLSRGVCSFAFDSLLSLFGWGEGVGVGVGWRSCFLQDWCGCMQGTELQEIWVRCYAGMKRDGME